MSKPDDMNISITIPESLFSEESKSIRTLYMNKINENSIVTLDFNNTKNIDSFGLGMFYMMIDRLNKNKNHLLGKNTNNEIKNILKLSSLDQFITFN